jgi:hypothetical protein
VERVESAWQSRDGEFKALRQERRIPKLLLAADLDGDGVVEFVSDTRLFHLRDGQLVQADNVSHWLR